MRLQSSEFVLMDSYIFIKDDEANELLNIAFPELEGTNLANKQDSNGKYFVREVLTTLRTEVDCWIEYMWPKPGQTEPSRKLASTPERINDSVILGKPKLARGYAVLSLTGLLLLVYLLF